MSKCDYPNCNDDVEYSLLIELLVRKEHQLVCKHHADELRRTGGVKVLREFCVVKKHESPPPTTARIESPVRPKRKEPRDKFVATAQAQAGLSHMSAYMSRIAKASTVYAREVLLCCDIVENVCQQIKKDLIIDENTFPLDLSLDE